MHFVYNDWPFSTRIVVFVRLLGTLSTSPTTPLTKRILCAGSKTGAFALMVLMKPSRSRDTNTNTPHLARV